MRLLGISGRAGFCAIKAPQKPNRKGQPISSVYFKAHEQGFETVKLEVRALNGGALPVKFHVKVCVFGVLAFAGTWVWDTVGFDAAPETIIA